MNDFEQLLARHQNQFGNVVPFNKSSDKYFEIKLNTATANVPKEYLSANAPLEKYLDEYLPKINARYAVGGYSEIRNAYSKSDLFDTAKEPRRLHIGVDIFGVVGTPVYLPFEGVVHSYGNNSSFGDYGPTLIMQHQLEGINFYTLYGHLSLSDFETWQTWQPNKIMETGSLLGHFGNYNENVGWAAHLHFQIIKNLGGKKGDYFGVCAESEAAFYLNNCPNPEIMLQLKPYYI
jgi:peptidoglycan LD-endopeptidase LytH